MRQLLEVYESIGPLTEAKDDFGRLLKMAWVKAANAANRRLREMEKAGPAYNVIDQTGGRRRVVGQLLGGIGFAWIQLSGRNREFINKFNKLSKGDRVWSFPGGRVYLSKVSRGYHLSFFDLIRGAEDQLMSPKEEGFQAALQYLQKAGYIKDAYVDSRLD